MSSLRVRARRPRCVSTKQVAGKRVFKERCGIFDKKVADVAILHLSSLDVGALRESEKRMVDSATRFAEVVRGLLGMPDPSFGHEPIDDGQDVSEVCDSFFDLGPSGGAGSRSLRGMLGRGSSVHRSSVNLFTPPPTEPKVPISACQVQILPTRGFAFNLL